MHKGTTKDSEKAFELYSKAAEAGHFLGQIALRAYHRNRLEITEDLEKEGNPSPQTTAEAGDLNAQYNLALCYLNGRGTTKDSEKAFELYSKAAEAGHLNAQYNLALCYLNGRGTTKDSEKAFELYSKAAEAGNLDSQVNLANCYLNGRGTTKDSEKAFELYSKAAEAGHLNAQNSLAVCYLNGRGTTKDSEKAFELYSKAAEAGDLNAQNSLADQDNLEYFILRFQNRSFKYRDNLKGEFLNFEAFFDQLSDEFKCFKCDNLGIIINGSPICPFCDSDKRDDTFKVVLPKCLECYKTSKDPLWCKSCEYSRFYKIWGKWSSGNENINQYIAYTQLSSENCRGCLEWISPNEIEFLDKVGEGGFGIVKKGSWEIGKILFWEKKSQKYERTGVTKVALKYLKDSQNIKYINSDEFISHHQSATCKYILECYGITKDITTDEYVMVLPFAEHGDLRAFLKLNKDILTWDMFLRILFQIAGGLRFIHESKLVHGDLHPGNILVLKTNPLKVVISDLGHCRPADYVPQSGKIYGILEYLAPEICKGSYHTKYSDIYSFAIISCEIISGERPFNNTDPINVVHDVIKGKRPTIKKHTPQCIQEINEKNWQYDPSCRDSAEELQQRVIAAHDNCHLNELVYEKRFYSEEIKDAQHDETRYKSQHISNFTCSMSGETFIIIFNV
ncbi:hypothetical protein G9A89_015745 [Geosiphon pyriformis]|nr:hypothetical protein G9A89_015745 [Geosiphon pyriformis]